MWLDNLNRIKKNSGMTIEQISEVSGVPKGTLNKLFAGQTKDPQLSTVSAVVHCMGYTLDDLSDDTVSGKIQLTPAQTALLDNFDQLNEEGPDQGTGLCRGSGSHRTLLKKLLSMAWLQRKHKNNRLGHPKRLSCI